MTSADARRPVYDAQQRTDGQLAPHLRPRLKLFPAPGVHTDLATARALAATDQQRAATLIGIAFRESERPLDAPGRTADPGPAAALSLPHGAAVNADSRRLSRVP